MLRVVLLIGVAIVAAISQSSAADPQYDAKSKLAADKGKTYMKTVSPTPIKLKIGMAYICGSYDKESNILTSRIHQRLSWVDERTAWNASDYGGLTTVRIPIERLWRPDIKLFNAFDDEGQSFADTNAHVHANGTIHWIPPATLKTYCDPHNEDQVAHCHLILGSWTTSKADVDLELLNEGVDTELYLDECPFVVTHATATIVQQSFPCCPGSFPKLDVSFDIQPRPKIAHHAADGFVTVKKEKRRSKSSVRKDPHTAKCVWPRCS